MIYIKFVSVRQQKRILGKESGKSEVPRSRDAGHLIL